MLNYNLILIIILIVLIVVVIYLIHISSPQKEELGYGDFGKTMQGGFNQGVNAIGNAYKWQDLGKSSINP